MEKQASNVYRALEEAESLIVAINCALSEFQSSRPRQCQESEVAFRFDSLIGILLMARNDVNAMIEMWQEECKGAHLAQFEGLDSPQGMSYLEGPEAYWE